MLSLGAISAQHAAALIPGGSCSGKPLTFRHHARVRPVRQADVWHDTGHPSGAGLVAYRRRLGTPGGRQPGREPSIGTEGENGDLSDAAPSMARFVPDMPKTGTGRIPRCYSH